MVRVLTSEAIKRCGSGTLRPALEVPWHIPGSRHLRPPRERGFRPFRPLPSSNRAGSGWRRVRERRAASPEQLLHVGLDGIGPDLIALGPQVQVVGHDLPAQPAVLLKETIA